MPGANPVFSAPLVLHEHCGNLTKVCFPSKDYFSGEFRKDSNDCDPSSISQQLITSVSRSWFGFEIDSHLRTFAQSELDKRYSFSQTGKLTYR